MLLNLKKITQIIKENWFLLPVQHIYLGFYQCWKVDRPWITWILLENLVGGMEVKETPGMGGEKPWPELELINVGEGVREGCLVDSVGWASYSSWSQVHGI